jgi:hypothetical protein
LWGETLSPRWPEGWETIDAGGEAVRTTYTRKLTDAKYDADNPHCRECDCAACHYFAKVEKALDRAAKYVSEVVEGCPIALELGYEICKEDGCDNDAAVCWMKYFLSEEARRGGEGVQK